MVGRNEEAKIWQTPEKHSQSMGHPLCRLMDCSLRFDIYSVSMYNLHTYMTNGYQTSFLVVLFP